MRRSLCSVLGAICLHWIASPLQIRAEEHQPAAAEQAECGQGGDVGRALVSLGATHEEILKEVRAIHEQEKARTEQGHADEEGVFSPTMLVQYGLLAVGILYTFFAALQWRAVGGTNKAAARALQLQQRPWVVPTGEIRTLPPEAYDSNEFRQWRFEIVLKNAGLSPALGIEVKGQNAISPARNPPPGPDDEFRPDQTFEFSVSMLGPGISNHIVGYAYEQFIERAREPGPSHKLWFWGIITYRDAFERTVTHTTRFCFRFVPGDGSYFEGPHNDCT